MLPPRGYGGIQAAFDGLSDGQEVAEYFGIGNGQVEPAAQRRGIERAALPDGDVAVDFPVVAAAVDGGIDGRRADPSADLRGGIQAAGNVLRGGGQKGLQCAQVGKGGGNPAAERCICHIAAEGVADVQIGVNPLETCAAVKQDSDTVVLKARFQENAFKPKACQPGNTASPLCRLILR